MHDRIPGWGLAPDAFLRKNTCNSYDRTSPQEDPVTWSAEHCKMFSLAGVQLWLAGIFLGCNLSGNALRWQRILHQHCVDFDKNALINQREPWSVYCDRQRNPITKLDRGRTVCTRPTDSTTVRLEGWWVAHGLDLRLYCCCVCKQTAVVYQRSMFDLRQFSDARIVH